MNILYYSILYIPNFINIITNKKMDDESLNNNVDNMIKLLKEKKCIDENEPVTEDDKNMLKKMSRAMTAPLFDDSNYHNGYFKPYQINEETRIELLEYYDKLEESNGLNKKELEANYLTNIEMIMNLRGSIINYETVVKNLNEQLKGYREVLYRAEEANRYKDKQLSELNAKNTTKIKQWISKNMDSMEKIKLLEKTLLQKDADLATISTSCSELTITNTKFDEKIKKQEKKIREHGVVLSQLKKTHEQEANTKNILIEELKSKVGTISQLQAEIKKLCEQNSCFAQEKIEFNTQIDKLTRDKNSIKFLHEKITKDYSKLKADFEQLEKLNATYLSKKLNNDALNTQVNELTLELEQYVNTKALLSNCQNELAEKQNKISVLQTQNSNLISQINSLVREIEINKADFEKQRIQLVNIQAQNIMLSKGIQNSNSKNSGLKLNNQNVKQETKKKNNNSRTNTKPQPNLKNQDLYSVQNLQNVQLTQATQAYTPEQIAQIQNLQQVYNIQQLKAFQQMCLTGQANTVSPTVSSGYVQGYNQEYNQEYIQTKQALNQQNLNVSTYYPNGYVEELVTVLYGEDGNPYIVDSSGNFLGYLDTNTQNYAC